MEKSKAGYHLRLSTHKKPIRLQSLPEQSSITGQYTVELPEINEFDSYPTNKYSRDRSVASRKERISELTQQVKVEKGRELMSKTLADVLEELNKKAKESDKIEVAKVIKQINLNVDFQDFIRHFFTYYNKYYRLLLYDQEGSLQVDLKLKKKILFTKESKEKYSKRGQLEDAILENQQLKKEVARLRQSVASLQKRIIRVVTQYKERKQIYIAEIQKLTKIINTSIISIPNLLLQNGKKIHESQSKKLLDTLQIEGSSMGKKQSEYNTLSSASPLQIGLQNTYRALSLQKKGKWPRFKSQQHLRIDQ